MNSDDAAPCVDFLARLEEIANRAGGLIRAPGCHTDFLPHPTEGAQRSVNVALVDEHRFAFTFWVKWAYESTKDRSMDGSRPALISLDYHNDVGCPGDYDEEELRNLDARDETLLGLFAWLGLPRKNDGHILPAAYLNSIGDVYVILKKLNSGPQGSNFEVEDLNGSTHRIQYFSSVSSLVAELQRKAPSEVYLDIDLDFFTESPADDFASIRLVSDSVIEETLSPSAKLMEFVLPRLSGLTIALEPRYCGGIQNSFHILQQINELLFSSGLFHSNCKWRDR